MKKKVIITLILLFNISLFACTDNTTTTQLTTESWSFSEPQTNLSFAEIVQSLTNPYNIGLFMTEDPEKSMGINFELPEEGSGFVEYRVQGSQQDLSLVVETIQKTRLVGKRTVYLHEAVMLNLTPGTTYEYRIRNASSTIVSTAYRFTVPSENLSEFSFLMMADPQESSEVGYMAYAHVALNAIAQIEQKPSFVLYVGDIINDADVRTQWNAFFKYSASFIFDTPIVATAGNHDISGISGTRMSNLEFDGYMNLPNNGPIYTDFDEIENDARLSHFDDGKTFSFNYGNVHFVAINTESLCDGTTTCAYMDESNVTILKNWLNADLTGNTMKWTIVFLHRGPYSLSYDTARVREQLVPIFETHGVDLVLSGHDHQYSRSVYKNTILIPFARSDNYLKGTISLIPEAENNWHFNDYSSSIGVTYLVGNTTGTKYYGGSRNSGIDVQYRFLDANPVVPYITVTNDYIKVVSYGMSKASAFQIEVDSVYVLETFYIRK